MAPTAQTGRTIPDFEIQQLHHPPVHQKLQLVSEDVRYLQKIFMEAAQSKIDTHLPSKSAEESLRAEVAEKVKEFIAKVFDFSKHSIVVNGMEGADPSLDALMKAKEMDKEEAEAVEPFDLELNEKVRELYAQIDDETVAVTKLRREAPLRAVEHYKKELEAEEINKKIHTLEDDDDSMSIDAPEVDIEKIIPRRDAIEADFDKFIASLREMKKTVPGTISKVERAEAVIAHLNSYKDQSA
ncbi:kinetochore protein Mis14 like-domain-containing protein [Myxozyma melibiosi]|uniref:Kinetochore protein Mis14 like-domain-containing protein n=1 Tax=Myxozyma melibiosi TaxID=54550 RepID=A0ABR1F8T6_9ASCO